jgi:hypothetical protein
MDFGYCPVTQIDRLKVFLTKKTAQTKCAACPHTLFFGSKNLAVQHFIAVIILVFNAFRQ